MPIEQEYTLPINVDSKTAKAIALLRSRLSNFETEHGRQSGLSYRPLQNDEVIITTSPKAGTTWLQQICHQWRVARQFGHGDDQFEEISQVVPWLELAYDQGQDVYAPQCLGASAGDGSGNVSGNVSDGVDNGNVSRDGSEKQQQRLSFLLLRPRIFKTHAWQVHCPIGFDKVIVGIRDPIDVVMSFYSFFQGWFFPSDPNHDDYVTMDDFVRHFWLARGIPTSNMENASYFVHLISWYQQLLLILLQENEQNEQQEQQKEEDDDEEEEDNNNNNNKRQPQRQPKILFVFYEDLKEDLEEQVRRIMSFLESTTTTECNVATTLVNNNENGNKNDAVIQLVVERCTFAYMKHHEHLFDEKLSKRARNVACGLPPDAGFHASKLRYGRSSSLSFLSSSSSSSSSMIENGGDTNNNTTTALDATLQQLQQQQQEYPWRRYYLQDEISLQLQDEIQQQWNKVVTPVTGCQTYADFRRHVKQLLYQRRDPNRQNCA